MNRTRLLAAGMVLLMRIGLAPAAEPGAVLAEGAWSKAVASGDGDSLRGRLVLVERRVVVGGRAHFPRQERRGFSVYVELQNAPKAGRTILEWAARRSIE